MSGSKITGKGALGHSAAAASGAGSRTAKTATKQPPKTGTKSGIRLAAHPESKSEAKSTARDAFLKKVQTCMNTYNYEDETADVKGKVDRLRDRRLND